MKADYENLFEMADPLNNRWMRLSPAEDPRWGRPDFDQWADQLLRGEAEADPPLRLVHKMGGKPADVMWSTFISFVVISERVVELLRAHGFTGWKTYAVEIYDRKGQHLPGYFGLGVTGRVGRRDPWRSPVVDKPPIVPGGKPYQVRKGLFFQDDFWDGSDFCCLEVGIEIIVTRRVAQAFQKAGIGRIFSDETSAFAPKRGKIGNVIFIPLPERETDARDVERLWGRPS